MASKWFDGRGSAGDGDNPGEFFGGSMEEAKNE
jgi:hypothetical protein